MMKDAVIFALVVLVVVAVALAPSSCHERTEGSYPEQMKGGK